MYSSQQGGWIPQDITWPTAYDVGALPQSDYRNERFKLIPRYVKEKYGMVRC